MEKRTLLNILGLKLHPSVVKPLGSLHTDWATPAHTILNKFKNAMGTLSVNETE
jgi:hypothetical protein